MIKRKLLLFYTIILLCACSPHTMIIKTSSSWILKGNYDNSFRKSEYFFVNNYLKRISEKLDTNASIESLFIYDEDNRLIRIENKLWDPNLKGIFNKHFFYNNENYIANVLIEYGIDNENNLLINYNIYEYDNNNRLIRVAHSDSNKKILYYDEFQYCGDNIIQNIRINESNRDTIFKDIYSYDDELNIFMQDIRYLSPRNISKNNVTKIESISQRLTSKEINSYFYNCLGYIKECKTITQWIKSGKITRQDTLITLYEYK